MIDKVLKFNPAIWLVLLVVLCYFDYSDWENNVYLPMQSQVEGRKQELQAVEAELSRIDDFIKNRDAKRAELERVNLEFDRVRKEFPTQADLPALMKSLADITEKIGIEFASFKPAGVVSEELWQAAQVDVTLKGSYVQVMSFLDSVANLPRIVNTEFLSLTPSDKADSSNFKLVNAQLKIRTYFGVN